MKRLWKCALLASWLLCVAGAASAFPVTLTLVPSTVSLTAGQFVTVDIVIGGLFDEEVALESFDLDLAFDKTRLLFTDVEYGGSLGAPNETFVIPPANSNANGVVELGVFSLLTGPDLLALQSAPFFLLATFEFQALASPGSALLEFINLSATSLGGIPGEGIGDELAAPSQLFVTIVPEPGVAALLAAAFALLARRARSARA